MCRGNQILLIFILFSSFTACEVDPPIKEQLPSNDIRFVVPPGWPNPQYDFSSNPLTKNGFILGRQLFYDTKLSHDNTISCGSCHQASAAFADPGNSVSKGINGLAGNRNSPSLFNLNWQTNFMWDGGINHIEVQPLAPISNPVEMDENLKTLVNKLQSDASYRKLFNNAFGTETVTSQLLLKALAQFMGMLESYNSKYDLYARGEISFTTAEMNGLTLFQQKCNTCHTTPLFTNLQYLNNGLDSFFTDGGRAEITGFASDSGKFKVPSLRNVALSSPYMHDGRFQTLSEVLDHYVSGIKNSSTLSAQLTGGIPLSVQEKQDILAFLNTLTDHTFVNDKRFHDPFKN
ncbi:MAG: cytochrome-c peroxidase [Bacteroidetes bacterium]|nr:cytochrome-c peroxidase [Bacteroidota bacterium]